MALTVSCAFGGVLSEPPRSSLGGLSIAPSLTFPVYKHSGGSREALLTTAFELGLDERDLREPSCGAGRVVWAHLPKADYEHLIMSDQTEVMP